MHEYVDGLSLHRYFENAEPPAGDSAKFLAMNLSMEKQIAETVAVCDLVRGHKRSPKNYGFPSMNGTFGIARAPVTP